MESITIDGIAYNEDALSKEAKDQIINIKYVQAEIGRLQATLAVFQTAENSYKLQLTQEIQKIDQNK